MPKTLAAGDTVQVADRESVAADAKSGLFYPHYGGLIGTIAKVYPDGTAAVTIDSGSLPEAVRTRHAAGSDAARQKWLDGLSDEARNRLSAAEKQFRLRYTILVSTADLNRHEITVRARSADLDDAEARHLEEIRKRKS